jgi:hypothetical protein
MNHLRLATHMGNVLFQLKKILFKGCGQFVPGKVAGNDVAKLETQGGPQLGNWGSPIPRNIELIFPQSDPASGLGSSSSAKDLHGDPHHTIRRHLNANLVTRRCCCICFRQGLFEMILSQARAADVCRRVIIDRRLLLLGCALASIALRPSRAEQPTSSNEALGKAVGVLAREKSAAEEYAVILATVGKSNTALYVRGIQLYADAKAEFDGLIAELKFDLKTGQDPARSAGFTEAVRGAAEKRVAFTSFVSHEVGDKVGGTRLGLPAVIIGVPELGKAIREAGQAIWSIFHDASNERRDAILSEVDQLRWRSFAELAKT